MMKYLTLTLSLIQSIRAFSSSIPSKVLVTGASGRTGQLVFSALLRDDRFSPTALVRSEKSAKGLKKAVPATGLGEIVICDVTKLDASSDTALPLNGCDSMVICTSAVPVISKRSLVKAMLKAPFNLIQGKKALDFRSFKFVWKQGQYPELVDYEGQVAQIDLAKRLGIRQIVVVSSMGGTDPSNFLNSVGKNKDGSGNGDILLWKRKAERYLVEESDLDYTIIHPGGLIDTPSGKEEFVLDVDDKLMVNKKRSISREDVANLCVAALVYGKGNKVSLDCITMSRNDDSDSSHVRVPSAEESFAQYLKNQKTYNYAL